ncbi:hypothetical protein [Kineococcus sp. SYSU DK018]|uniref:hypothetical protein n=1 Tax=Kineococcus sp. SYSU DK018 TaxID=3383139 RepID=UPI003D7EB386
MSAPSFDQLLQVPGHVGVEGDADLRGDGLDDRLDHPHGLIDLGAEDPPVRGEFLELVLCEVDEGVQRPGTGIAAAPDAPQVLRQQGLVTPSCLGGVEGCAGGGGDPLAQPVVDRWQVSAQRVRPPLQQLDIAGDLDGDVEAGRRQRCTRGVAGARLTVVAVACGLTPVQRWGLNPVLLAEAVRHGHGVAQLLQREAFDLTLGRVHEALAQVGGEGTVLLVEGAEDALGPRRLTPPVGG